MQFQSLSRLIQIGLLLSLSLGGCKKEAADDPAAAKKAPVEETQDSKAKADGESNEKTKSPDTSADEAKSKLPKIEKPFLWRVSKDGKEGYLLGTIHLGVDAEKQFPAFVWKHVDAADHICLEVDTTDPDSMKIIMRNDNSTLEQELGPKAWKQFVAIVGEGMAGGMQRMKAWGATALIYLKDLPMTPSMDMVIHMRAKKNKQKLHYLETLKYQAGVMEKHMGADAMRFALENYEKGRPMIRKMLEAYQAGDEKTMHSVLTDKSMMPPGGDDAMEALLYTRNANWIGKYEELMASGKPLCAVGAGHLIGDRSVNDLLAKKGYKVERITE